MTSSNTISEIKDLVSDPESQLTTKTGLRLLLTVSSEMWEQMETINKTIQGIVERQAKQEQDIAELKSHSIMLWTQNNPKWAVSALVLFIIVMDIVIDKISWLSSWKYLEEILFRSVGL